MVYSAIFAIFVGVGMIGQQLASFLSNKIPELKTEPIRIWFHIAAELITASGERHSATFGCCGWANGFSDGCGNAFLHAHRQSWIFRPTGKLDRIDHVLCVDRTCFNWDRSGRSKSVMEER